jgi:hypothetical protein
MTTRRELDDAIFRADALIEEVYDEAIWMNVSPKVAYRRIMKRREQPAQDARDFDSGGADFDGGPDSAEATDAEDRRLFEEAVRLAIGINARTLPPDEYEEMFREFQETVLGGARRAIPPEDEREPDEPPRRQHSPRAEPARPERSRLKELYRTLVRRLHPDTQADANPQVSALWHEVQEAYNRGDVDRLETLLALSELHAGALNNSTSASQLHAVRAELKANLNAIRRALRKARKHPAWQFEKRDLRELEGRIRRQMEYDIRILRKDLADMEVTIDEWKQPPKRKKKPGKSFVRVEPRRPATQDEFPF